MDRRRRCRGPSGEIDRRSRRTGRGGERRSAGAWTRAKSATASAAVHDHRVADEIVQGAARPMAERGHGVGYEPEVGQPLQRPIAIRDPGGGLFGVDQDQNQLQAEQDTVDRDDRELAQQRLPGVIIE